MPNGRFSQQLLSEDVGSIKYLYLANGFLDVKVDADLLDDYLGKKNEMEVLLKIEEGKQTLVGNLKLEGAVQFRQRSTAAEPHQRAGSAVQRSQYR